MNPQPNRSQLESDDTKIDLVRYFRVVWRRKLTVILPVIFITSITAFGVRFMSPVFVSSAKVHVEKRTRVNKELERQIIGESSSRSKRKDELARIKAQVGGREFLEIVARVADKRPFGAAVDVIEIGADIQIVGHGKIPGSPAHGCPGCFHKRAVLGCRTGGNRKTLAAGRSIYDEIIEVHHPAVSLNPDPPVSPLSMLQIEHFHIIHIETKHPHFPYDLIRSDMRFRSFKYFGNPIRMLFKEFPFSPGKSIRMTSFTFMLNDNFN